MRLRVLVFCALALALLCVFCVSCVFGLGVSFPMWNIYDDRPVVFSSLTVVASDSDFLGSGDLVVLVDESDSGLILFNGSVVPSGGVVLARACDFVAGVPRSFPVGLAVNWSCGSRSFPLCVLVLHYNESLRGFSVSVGVRGFCSANDLRVRVSEGNKVLFLCSVFCLAGLRCLGHFGRFSDCC